MIKNLKNKKISSEAGFSIIFLLFFLVTIFTIWKCDSSEIILEYLILILNKKHLYNFFSVVFGGFIALFALLGFVIVEKTKYLIERILLNPKYIKDEFYHSKSYKFWMYITTFNPEILRFFEWEEMKKLINPAILENYEGKNYKKAFCRLKNITENFNLFFWPTIILLFVSLMSFFLIPFSDIYYIKLIIGLFVIFVFLLSLFSLIFAALVIKSLFLYGSKKEIEKLKKEIFEE